MSALGTGDEPGRAGGLPVPGRLHSPRGPAPIPACSALSLPWLRAQRLLALQPAQVSLAGQGVAPIPLEGLAQEKPNPRVSDLVEGGALPPTEMSQPEGLDT